MMMEREKDIIISQGEKRAGDKPGKANHHAQWPKNRHYVGNAGHYYYCGIRFAAIIVPFILALFIAVILNPLVQHMVRWRVPRVLAVSILMTIIVMAMVLLLAYLGSALNELTRTFLAISQLYYDAAASP